MTVAMAQACAPWTFNLSLPGAEIISLAADLVTNFTASVEEIYRYTLPAVEGKNVSFCNVTVTYTHPGQNDNIITEAWLPLEWNERFMAVGGGGYVAGRFFLSYAAMNGAVADGYATITTDAGLGSAQEPSPWALNSPGNVNLYNLQNVGSVSLNDGVSYFDVNGLTPRDPTDVINRRLSESPSSRASTEWLRSTPTGTAVPKEDDKASCSLRDTRRPTMVLPLVRRPSTGTAS